METPPEFVKLPAIDVVPGHYGVYCTVGESRPFVNAIVLRGWSEDGAIIRFMLDTHNFIGAEPDQIISVVPMSPCYSAELQAKYDREDELKMANRPGHPHWRLYRMLNSDL